ncbi:MAG: protein-glutamate O-methyltransferase CheR [Isosphaeraceae bacterium]
MNLTELTPDEYDRFCALIYKVAGNKSPATKRVMMANRLRRRLRATEIGTFAEYYAHLTSPAGAVEMPRFLDEITTNETYFYRDVHHFDWLTESFFPEVLQAGRLRRRPKTLRIWSAAASTGEELYSIALRFAPFRTQFKDWDVTLLGTDLSGAVLATARAGSYDDRAMRLVGLEDRKRYFDRDEATQRWVLKDEIRKLPRWKIHNLLTPVRDAPFDCVFIKNVLIYFDLTSKQTVVKHLIQSLAPGGYLVVGPTEGIYSMLGALEKVKPWLYRRRAD